MGEAEQLADEHREAALVVQHSDRLARGDGRRAKHLVAYALWAIENDVRILSVQDPPTFDPDDVVYAAIEGKRNHDDSARKSKATRDGLRRRKERGEPVGSMPLGYTVEHDGPQRRRVVDPATRPTIERIFDM